MFGDGKSQAGAADFAGAGDIDAVEALEDAGLVGAGDADAGVGNREGDFGVVSGSADGNLATGGGVLHGVVEEILQDFGETAAVGGDVRHGLLQIHGDAQIFFGGGALRGFDATLDELGNAQAANLKFQAVGIHFGKLEQSVGEPLEALGVFEE